MSAASVSTVTHAMSPTTAWLAAVACAAMPGMAGAQTPAAMPLSSPIAASAALGASVRPPLPGWLAARLPGADLRGQGRLRFFGLDIYDALLWTAPGFDPASFERHALALQLVYRRGLVGEQIAERSLTEMRALPGFDASRADTWLARMKTLFPDVAANDQLVGLYQPGVGVGFWLNGQPRGEVADPLFARLFMGIWLSPQTSEPRLRQALLGLAAP